MNFLNLKKSKSDAKLEEERYENRARNVLASSDVLSLYPPENDPILDQSKIFYEKVIEELLVPQAEVLEIGAGTGDYSWKIVDKQAKVTLLDISASALDISKLKFGNKATYVCANMEKLPFPDSHFDFVLSAGSLSYGNYETVRNEIIRVLKPNGTLIVLDSLNHNILFRLNRYRHYLMGQRTLSTIRRIPTMQTIEDIKENFQFFSVSFFGRHLIFYTFAKLILRRSLATRALHHFDLLLPNNKRSFKFVVVASNLVSKFPS